MDDVDRIMAVMDAAFDPHWGEAWNRKQLSDALVTPSTHYLLCDDAGDWPDPQCPAAGFLLSRAAPGEEELLLVAIRPTLRGQGLGQKLIGRYVKAALARGAEALFLQMRENNPARNLYEKCDFEAIGQRTDYYRTADGNKIDAITFKRVITN